MQHNNGPKHPYGYGSADHLRKLVRLIGKFQRETDKPPPNQHNEDSKDDALARYTRHLAVGTWVIAGAGVATFGAALLQWSALHNTDEKIGKQVAAMRDQLAIMQTASDQTDKMIAANRSAMIATVRAWMAPTNVELLHPLKFGQPIVSRIYFKNLGKEPALDINIHSVPAATQSQPPKADLREIVVETNDTCDGLEPVVGGQVLYPDAENSLSITTHPYLATREMLTGTWLYYMRGCFVYRTMGEVHRTGFCRYLNPRPAIPSEKWQYASCPTGNFAD